MSDEASATGRRPTVRDKLAVNLLHRANSEPGDIRSIDNEYDEEVSQG
jgi:hypothetical protein